MLAIQDLHQAPARLPMPEKMGIGKADEVAVTPVGEIVKRHFPAWLWLRKRRRGDGRGRFAPAEFLQPGPQLETGDPLHLHSGRWLIATNPVRSRPGSGRDGDHQRLDAIGLRILGKGPGPQRARRLQGRIPEGQNGDFELALVHHFLQVRNVVAASLAVNLTRFPTKERKKRGSDMWLMPPPGLNPDCLILPIMANIVEEKHAAAK